MSVNSITQNLTPYPMEELAKIKQNLKDSNKEIFDFGTGDPNIELWEEINKTIEESLENVLSYPSIKGMPQLHEAINDYLRRQLQLEVSEELKVLPTNGSKEAIFHTALCLIGREKSRKYLVYPTPGYPVYRSSALFAGGTPYAVALNQQDDWLLKPWELPKQVQQQTAALWINYPHNPTGATAPKSYLEKVIQWCHDNNVILLSDDCYFDIYDPDNEKPICPLSISSKNVISFMSLSKRSGFTGYRSGFMAGDGEIISQLTRARANFGCATPNIIQAAAAKAWADDEHVSRRRQVFKQRIDYAAKELINIGLLKSKPEAAFYLWCTVPEHWQGKDIEFSLELAKEGVITTPSSWLSEGTTGYVRFAMVPELDKMASAFSILKNFIKK